MKTMTFQYHKWKQSKILRPMVKPTSSHLHFLQRCHNFNFFFFQGCYHFSNSLNCCTPVLTFNAHFEAKILFFYNLFHFFLPMQVWTVLVGIRSPHIIFWMMDEPPYYWKYILQQTISYGKIKRAYDFTNLLQVQNGNFLAHNENGHISVSKYDVRNAVFCERYSIFLLLPLWSCTFMWSPSLSTSFKHWYRFALKTPTKKTLAPAM